MAQFHLRNLLVGMALVALALGCYRADSPFLLLPAMALAASVPLYRAGLARSRHGLPSEGIFVAASAALCLAIFLAVIAAAVPAIR